MPLIDVVRTCRVEDTFRTRQIAGLFDFPWQPESEERFCVEVPGLEEDWQIGLIAGPSGSGKSTVARAAFGPACHEAGGWPAERAVVDCLEGLSASQVAELFTAVGFSSPRAWLRPFAALSTGEQFRCQLARALSGGCAAHAEPRPLVVCDEFTSTVDRRVAQTAALAVNRALRGGRLRCRFVAVTVHEDVAPWLEPDWVVDMGAQQCHRGRLRRGTLELAVHRCHRSAWALFARHHYLSGQLSRSARCWLALCEGQPAAFCATIPAIGRRGHWRITRLVTLPDFQGIGVGARLAAWVAGQHVQAGCRASLTTSHPGLIAHCVRSADWRTTRVCRAGRRPSNIAGYCGARGRAVMSFEYVLKGDGLSSPAV